MEIRSVLKKIFAVIIKVFSMISSPLKALTKFIHRFLPHKFRKYLVRALLIMTSLVVIIGFGTYGVDQWRTRQLDKKIQNILDSLVTYSEQKSEEYDVTSPPPLLEIVEEDSSFSPNPLDATRTGYISLHIRNDGGSDANNLTIQLFPLSKDSQELSKDSQELSFDTITKVPPVPKNGGELTVEIPVRGTDSLSTGTAKIGIFLVDSDFKQKIPAEPLIFKTRRLRTPELVLGDSAVNEKKSASPNQRINPNETIELIFRVRNEGTGAAEEVKIEIKNEQTGVIPEEKTDETKSITRTFSEIKRGGYEEITYNYFINSEFTEAELIFTITATEKGKQHFSEPKKFPIDSKPKPRGKINPVSIDDEAELHKRPQVKELPPLKSSGNPPWTIIISIAFCGGLFIIIWKRSRRGKKTTPGSTTPQSKPSNSDRHQKAAYKAATGRKERFK